MIFALGSNGAGQLGIGHDNDTPVPQPLKIIAEHGHQHTIDKVVKIVAGGNHTLVLDAQDNVFAAGNNEDGRCALADETSVCTFKQITLLPSGLIWDVSASWSASFFLEYDQQTIWTCGTGEHGELGLGETLTKALLPRKIQPFASGKVAQMSSGVWHTVIVFDHGQVWGWGKGRKGQLGSPSGHQWTPRRIEIPFFATAAAAGADFTCILGHPSSGDVQILGSDKYDRFRLRADLPRSIPPRAELLASWGTAYAFVSGQPLIAWGRQDRGQTPPTDLPRIVDFAAGSEHWVALSAAGQVLTGGWGEHGNCGMITDANSVVKDRYNVVQVTGRVVRVFAGCATSFLVTD